MYEKSLINYSLFKGLAEEQIASALSLLEAHEKHYKKKQPILRSGSLTDWMGLILEGSITIENNDAWGNTSLLNSLGKGEFFAESYAYLNTPVLVDVIANESTTILFLNLHKLQQLDAHKYPWAFKITQNLLSIATQKNLALSQRSFHTASKSIRARVMSYLNHISIQQQTNEFDIPFNRQQMADYLNVERTALSKELRKMEQDHLISFHKNHFNLIFVKKDTPSS